MWRVCVHSIYNLYKKKSMTHLIEQSLYRKTFSFRRWFYCNFLLTWISPFSQTTLQHGCSKSFPLDASSKITSHLIFLIFHLTIFYKTLFNMKLAIATSLFASAAAFAPSASKVRKLTWADSCYFLQNNTIWNIIGTNFWLNVLSLFT